MCAVDAVLIVFALIDGIAFAVLASDDHYALLDGIVVHIAAYAVCSVNKFSFNYVYKVNTGNNLSWPYVLIQIII